MLQDMQHILDRRGGVTGEDRPVRLVLPKGAVGKDAITAGRLGQQLQGDLIASVAEHHLEPGLVVFEMNLPSHAEHVLGIHAVYVVGGGFQPPRPAQVLMELVEEQLDMVWYPTSQTLEHLAANPLWNADLEGQSQFAEARDRGLLVHGFRSKGVKTLAWALSPACSRIGSRPTLPETISRRRPRCAYAFLRSQLMNSSASRLRSGVIR